MKHLFLKTIVLIVLFFIAKPVFGAVVINEIAWMGTEISSSDEWIELYNDSTSSVDIKNWSIYGANTGECLNLSSASADGSINTIVPASGYLVYANHKTDLGVDVVDIWDATIGINDTSPGQMTLYDAPDCIIDNAIDTIDQSTKWLYGNSKTKRTMERTSTGWQTSLNPDGTPKAQNSTGVIEETGSLPEESSSTSESPEQIASASSTNGSPTADAGDNIMGFVNQEIGFDGTKSSDPESNELHYGWNMGNGKLIETPSFTYAYAFPGTYLVTLMVFDGKNYASDTITVKIQQAQITINEFMANPTGKDEEEEWIEIYNGADSITDISGWQIDDIASGSKPFVFPQNTLIAPKSYLVFSRQITKITLNNDKDSVRLLLSDGTVFQEINYEKPPQGKSSAKTGDGFVWSEPTPGMANIVGLAVKSEKQTVYQQNSVIAQTVKDPPQNYVINLPDNEISGGYINTSPNDQFSMTNNSASPIGGQTPATNADKLASIKQVTQNPANLALIIVAIVFGAGFLGLLLIKFRKRSLPRA